jgi:hypothetical protein
LLLSSSRSRRHRPPRPPAAASGRRRRLFLASSSEKSPPACPAVRLRVFLACVSGRPPRPRSYPLDRIASVLPLSIGSPAAGAWSPARLTDRAGPAGRDPDRRQRRGSCSSAPRIPPAHRSGDSIPRIPPAHRSSGSCSSPDCFAAEICFVITKKKERERESYVFFFVVVGLPCDSSLPGDI